MRLQRGQKHAALSPFNVSTEPTARECRMVLRATKVMRNQNVPQGSVKKSRSNPFETGAGLWEDSVLLWVDLFAGREDCQAAALERTSCNLLDRQDSLNG